MKKVQEKSAQRTKAATAGDVTTSVRAESPRVSETAELREIEGLAIDAREQLGIVLLDLFDREHATGGGDLVLYEPLAQESVDALRQTIAGILCILRTTRELLQLHGAKPDLESKFAAPDAVAGPRAEDTESERAVA